MENNAYEKAITGRNLERIFNSERFNTVENYRIHIETVNGTKNNYITDMEDDKVLMSDIYVSDEALLEIKTL